MNWKEIQLLLITDYNVNRNESYIRHVIENVVNMTVTSIEPLS